MDDKWFVWADGPDAQGRAVVHMFRSWTGHKMAEVRLQIPVDGEGRLTEADSHFTEIIWESASDRHAGVTEEGAKVMVKIVCKWCMNASLP